VLTTASQAGVDKSRPLCHAELGCCGSLYFTGATRNAEEESRPITQLERRKLTDARSMLKTLSKIASQGKRAASEALQPQRERLG
jgi:hypothetical protein